MKCEEHPKLGFADSQLLLHDRHGQRQIFAHEIKSAVADRGPKQNPRPEIGVAGADFIRIGNRSGRRRRPEELRQPCRAGSLHRRAYDWRHAKFRKLIRGFRTSAFEHEFMGVR